MFTNQCARCGKIEKAPHYATPYFCAACEGEPEPLPVLHPEAPAVVLIEPEIEGAPELKKGDTGFLFFNADLLTEAPLPQ